MLRQFCCLLFLLLCGIGAHADNLVDFKKGDNISVADANQRLKRIFGKVAPAPTKSSIDLYRVRYRSQNEKGASVILTGLVALPRSGAPRGLVVFSHGTTGDRSLSPSRFTAKSKVGEAQWAILAFASGGYGVAMPDYLGLGDDPGAHPYPLWKLNSLSATDIITPARIIAAKNKLPLGTNLYLTGYSEGGSVTMWAARTLEAKSIPITAAAPLSGAYDLSGETRKALLSPAKDLVEFAAQLYLLSYTARYFNKSQGVPLTNYMKPSLASVVARVFDSGFTDETIIKRIVFTAILMGANNSIEKVMAPRFIKALEKFDTTDPVLRELKANDCYDWAPRTKMLMVALENDNIVTDANTRIALKTMRSRGVTAATLREHFIRDEKLNHLTAPVTSLALARKFFDGGFSAVGK